MIDLKASPFFLSDEGLSWVEDILSQMSQEEKIGQLFCLTGMSTDPRELAELVRRYRPGAYLFRPGEVDEIRNATQAMQAESRLPLLFPCNLESGGNGLANSGTFFAKPLAVAATGSTEHAKRLGLVCAREAAMLGCNWSLAPIIDIDYNWRNPITNVRTFGADSDRVLKMASAYMDGVKESGYPMAVCLKHFPGDGVDERDQHLLPTINSLSAEEWFKAYGHIYQTLINKGASAVMAGHILQPSLEREIQSAITDGELLPASHSKNLLTGILRDRMGFNGVIITDATPMVGFSALRTRSEALRLAVNAGADMIMFCKNIEEDYAAIRDGLHTGEISEERLNDAVLRQLALKASLGLHRSRDIPTDANWIDCEEHRAWAKACADDAVTLIKDEESLLPLSPQKTPRVRLTILGEKSDGGFGDNASIQKGLKKKLEEKGFDVHLYDYGSMEQFEIFTAGISDLQNKFDLSIIAANVATGSNHTTRRLDWITLMAADAPWYCRDIPTVFISFCNPYHLFDIPYVGCYVNAYTSNSFTVESIVEKLIGESGFTGVSPVNPMPWRK